jgi:hypothetical protein
MNSSFDEKQNELENALCDPRNNRKSVAAGPSVYAYVDSAYGPADALRGQMERCVTAPDVEYAPDMSPENFVAEALASSAVDPTSEPLRFPARSSSTRQTFRETAGVVSFGDREPAALPSSKHFLEKHSHFFVKPSVSARDASALILASLKESLVDTEIDPDRYRVRCDAYPDGSHVIFHVNFYLTVASSDTEPGMVVVEYQRRHGDVIIFSELYRQGLRAMHKVGAVQEQKLRDLGFAGLQWAPGYLPPDTVPCAPRPVTDLSRSGAEASLGHMADMLQSTYCDVKMNAAEAAGALSADAHNQLPIANSSLGEVLVQNLACESADVRRACCTAVAHLAANKEAAQRLCALGAGARLVELIEQPFCQQSVREAGRGLSNLSKVAGADLCADKGKLRAAMERLKKVAEWDERTAASLKSASAALLAI